ncbi:hypothetical protein B0H13DRAFT_1857577 [Mycena leptocephala]|nr:hypothetical protein B0H13DRAFT_1857577 [Mycena leptocephala]
MRQVQIFVYKINPATVLLRSLEISGNSGRWTHVQGFCPIKTFIPTPAPGFPPVSTTQITPQHQYIPVPNLPYAPRGCAFIPQVDGLSGIPRLPRQLPLQCMGSIPGSASATADENEEIENGGRTNSNITFSTYDKPTRVEQVEMQPKERHDPRKRRGLSLFKVHRLCQRIRLDLVNSSLNSPAMAVIITCLLMRARSSAELGDREECGRREDC